MRNAFLVKERRQLLRLKYFARNVATADELDRRRPPSVRSRRQGKAIFIRRWISSAGIGMAFFYDL
jgi:hypothetical protein